MSNQRKHMIQSGRAVEIASPIPGAERDQGDPHRGVSIFTKNLALAFFLFVVASLMAVVMSWSLNDDIEIIYYRTGSLSAVGLPSYIAPKGAEALHGQAAVDANGNRQFDFTPPGIVNRRFAWHESDTDNPLPAKARNANRNSKIQVFVR